MAFNLILVIIVFILSTILFKYACGTLNPLKLNIISLTYYSLVGMYFIGSGLIFSGFTDHYMIKKIVNSDTINKTYSIITYLMIIMPTTMILISKVFKFDIKHMYNNYLEKSVDVENESPDFIAAIILGSICILSCIYVFVKIGNVAFIDILLGQDSESFAVKRILYKKGFEGNIYIRNILALGLTPIISYFACVYYFTTKSKKWLTLFIALFISSILIKTYDYEKFPLIWYLLGFFPLRIIIGKELKTKHLAIVGGATILLIVMMYIFIMGYNFSDMSIYTGPIGRILFSQVGALFLHVDTFPYRVDFLNGQSFPNILLKLLSITGSQVRSGEVVIQLYNQKAVESGTAGVMNTLFIGEAYANFGMLGVVLGAIYVAMLLHIIFIIFIKLKKDPINTTLYLSLTMMFVNTIQGGFIDFIYNPIVYVVIIIFISMRIWKEKLYQRILFKINKRVDKGEL